MHRTRALPVASALVLLIVGGTALAGTVYKWTDENGVVHFADVPPPKVHGVGTEQMPEPPPPVAAETPPPAAGETPAREQRSGPARVVIGKREESDLGEGAHSFSGTVKNEGGAEAKGVVVAIRVVEPTQGDECLRDEIEVEPSTLAPGASGKFDASFTNPCFKGPTETDLRVDWE